MADLFKNYIDGEWVEAKSRKTFDNRNPANRHDLIGLFPASGGDDVDLDRGHGCYPAPYCSFFARSTASSIVPTM